MSLLTLACLLLTQASLPPSYRVEPIPLPISAEGLWSAQINRAGDVAVSGGTFAAVLGRFGSQILLPVAPGEGIILHDLADNRRVLGVSFGFSAHRAVVWAPDGASKELRALPGGLFAEPLDGTGDGWIVGFSDAPVPNQKLPVAWLGGVLTELDLPFGTSGAATAIDARHRIAGWASDSGKRGWIREGLGPPVEIGLAPGHTENCLLDLNAHAGGVGWSRGILDYSSAMYWRDGMFTIFPPWKAYMELHLSDVNRQGIAIGNAGQEGDIFPIVSDGTELVQIAERIDAASSRWLPILAYALDEGGVLLCTCWSVTGQLQLCRLIPNAPSATARGSAVSRGELPPGIRAWMRREAQRVRASAWLEGP